MHWLYFAFLNVVGSALANIFRRILMKDDKSDAFASAICFQLLGFLMILIFSLVRGLTLPPITKYPLNFVVMGLLWGLMTIFYFKASQYIEASELAILSTSTSVVTIALAILILHDIFNLNRLLGVILILSSVILVSFQPGKMHFNKGVLFALLGSLSAGLATTNDVFLLRYIDVFSLLLIDWFTPGIFLMIVNPSAVVKMKYFFNKKRFLKIFLLAFFYVVGGTAYYIAITVGAQLSQISPISQTSIIVTVLLAAIFLKERDHLLKKIFSAVLVTIGVLLLS